MPDELPRPDVSNSVDDASGQFVQASSVRDVHFHGAVPQRASFPLRIGLVPLRAASFQERSFEFTSQVIVLSGMGGVGKTQLAANHAEQLWSTGEIQLLIWVTAGSREAIIASYADAAAQLTGNVEPDPEQGARRLLEWLAGTNIPWLIVLDDLQTPTDLAELWPPRNGRSVVTTRRRDAALCGDQRQIVDVDVFGHDESVAYLRTVLTGKPGLVEGAEDLVRDLGYLPLALAQAGAYLRDRHLTCAQYRTRFAKRKLANVLPDVLPDQHRDTVAATWSLSVELADALPPKGVARPLLDIASALDSNGIPVGVFTAPAVLRFLEIDEDDARDGLGCLHRLSLITLNLDSPSREVRIHALVQRATREPWTDEKTGQVAKVAANAVRQIWPEIERDTVLGQVLRTNTDALADVAGEHLWHPDGHSVLFRAGKSRGECGLVVDARNYFAALLEIANRVLGPDHPNTLTTRSYLAHWQGRAGDPAAAENALQQLLTDRTRILGPNHPSTLATRHNLARWQGKAGDPAQAVEAFHQLLTEHNRVLGPNHPSTLITRGNLANLQGKAGDATGAAEAFEQLLTDQIRILGPNHVDTLTTRHNLADWQGKAGDPASAVRALQELLTDQIRILGPNHPSTLTTRHNLADWQGEAGDATGAAEAFEQLLTDQIRILGPNHVDTLITSRNLVYWRKRAGKGSADGEGGAVPGGGGEGGQ